MHARSFGRVNCGTVGARDDLHLGGSPGNWSVGTDWTGGVAPAGHTDTDILLFNSGGYVATNDLFSPSRIGQFIFSSTDSAVTLAGAPIAIAGASPSFFQSGAAGVLILNNVTMDSTTTFAGASRAPITMSGVLSGTGSLVQNGSAPLVLTATETFAGPTTIAGGTIQLGDGGTTGYLNDVITNNGVLAFNRADNFTFSGSVSGSGKIRQAGTGVLTLGVTNTCAGGTEIAGGTLAIASDSLLGGHLVTFSGGTLQFNNYRSTLLLPFGGPNISLGAATGAPSTFAGSIPNTSSLTFVGPGTLILEQNFVYTGGTTIAAGTLQLNNGSTLAGTITNNSQLLLSSNIDSTYSGVITSTAPTPSPSPEISPAPVASSSLAPARRSSPDQTASAAAQR